MAPQATASIWSPIDVDPIGLGELVSEVGYPLGIFPIMSRIGFTIPLWNGTTSPGRVSLKTWNGLCIGSGTTCRSS